MSNVWGRALKMFKKGIVWGGLGRADEDRDEGKRKPRNFKGSGTSKMKIRNNAKNGNRSKKLFNKSVTKQKHKSLCTY